MHANNTGKTPYYNIPLPIQGEYKRRIRLFCIGGNCLDSGIDIAIYIA